MNVECTACNTSFPIDPKKVPAEGVHARCSVCSEVFFVSVPEPAPAPEFETEGQVAEDAVETAQEETDVGWEEPDEPVEPVAEEPVAEEPVAEEPPPAEETHSQEAEAQDAYGGPERDPDETRDFVDEVEESPAAEVEAPLPTPTFGQRDPGQKAQRLARVLVSDIILYNPDRHQMALEAGQIAEEFQEEIQKSWNEYVEQVGEETANSTPFFNDALNEILAKGEKVF